MQRTRQQRLRFVFVTTIFLLSIATVPAQAQRKFRAETAATRIVEAYRRDNNLPGVSVAIARDGKIVYAKAVGWQDREAKIPASTKTRFRLASICKPITAIIAMELVEQGKLKLDANIRSLLKLPAHHTYTVRDLLCHQSGVRHYRRDIRDPTLFSTRTYRKANQAMSLFTNDRLVNAPGEKFHYSTHGFTVLAAAIEASAKADFAVHATKRFRAWGLKDLGVERPSIRDRYRTQIYTSRNGINRVSRRDDLSWKTAGGGLQCTASDLCSLGILLLSDEILKKPSRRQMWTRQKTKNGTVTSYALGWRIAFDKQRRRIVEHSGSQNGARSHWRLYPEQQIVIAVLTNRGDNNPKSLTESLAKLVFQEKSAKPRSQPKP